MNRCDLLVVGAGTAGLPSAIFAARAGASVVVIEADDVIGGTLHLSAGQISAAGTAVQAARGIDDDPDRHFDDIMRISRGSANPALTRLAVDNLPDTFAWLLASGVTFPVAHPVIDPVNEPYSVPRTSWSVNGGRDILKAIRPQFDEQVAAGRITLHRRTKLAHLLVEDGAVVGASVTTPAGPRDVRARRVVLSTGGFTANDALFESVTGRPKFGAGHAFAKGEGLVAAIDAGGMLVNRDKFLPAFAAVQNATARDGFAFETLLDPGIRPPWEIFVDEVGLRFMREDQPVLGDRQRALLTLPGLRFWVIYDAHIERLAPSLFAKASWQAMHHRFAERAPGFVQGDTIADLAERMAVDSSTLENTIARYNRDLASGSPDPFARRHRPVPIGTGTMRAVRHHGWSPTGFAGIGVDEKLQVTRRDGTPIDRLFAAGEIVGMATTGGRSFCSGMSLGPALTFGRLLGEWVGQS